MESKFNPGFSRAALVFKANALVQRCSFCPDLNESKAVLYLISKIRPDDAPETTYVFDAREFKSLLPRRSFSKRAAEAILRKIADSAILPVDGRAPLRWFDIVSTDDETGSVTVRFCREMREYLFNLRGREKGEKGFYTAFSLRSVMPMRRRYSLRIYEILRSYVLNNSRWTFENGTGSKYDLQMLIAPVARDAESGRRAQRIPRGWRNWAIFRRDVLDPAVEEINRYTDIKVAYAGRREDICHRRTASISCVEFYMVKKTDSEQQRTDELIDARYARFEQHAVPDTVGKDFFDAHAKCLEHDRLQKVMLADDELYDRYVATRHPALFGELVGERGADFDEAKLELLYNTAIETHAYGVPEHRLELFAVDLILYYYDIIAATPEETKSTTFKRLLSCVRRDYDRQAGMLCDRYTGEYL